MGKEALHYGPLERGEGAVRRPHLYIWATSFLSASSWRAGTRTDKTCQLTGVKGLPRGQTEEPREMARTVSDDRYFSVDT